MFADWAGIEPGQTVLDVGCGSGILTQELAERLGAAIGRRGRPVRRSSRPARRASPRPTSARAPAENLPWPDGTFDAALAQLVIHFLEDPVVGLAEMRRVVRGGGIVAACSWNFPEMQLLDVVLGVGERGRARRRGSSASRTARRRGSASLAARRASRTSRRARSRSRAPTRASTSCGACSCSASAPAAQYLVGLPEETRNAIRDEYFRRIGEPAGGFTLRARASRPEGPRARLAGQRLEPALGEHALALAAGADQETSTSSRSSTTRRSARAAAGARRRRSARRAAPPSPGSVS